MTVKITNIRVVCDFCGCYKETCARTKHEAFNYAAMKRGFRKVRVVGKNNVIERSLMLCLTCLVSKSLVTEQGNENAN